MRVLCEEEREYLDLLVLSYIPYQWCGCTKSVLARAVYQEDTRRNRMIIEQCLRRMDAKSGVVILERKTKLGHEYKVANYAQAAVFHAIGPVLGY